MAYQNLKKSRRSFLKKGVQTSAALSGFMAVPASVLGRGGTPPGERVSMGVIGIGGRGTHDLKEFLADGGVYVRAVCDIKQEARQKAKRLVDNANGNSDCQTYRDLREMLDRNDIDAVLIATGPNWHAVAASLAARAGKDVYCEKPCSKNVVEAVELADVFRRTGRIYQAGTQRRSVTNFVFACQLARSGRLGKLRTVHAPDYNGGFTVLTSGWANPEAEPAAEQLDWDMYLGPAAWRPYNKQHMQGNHFEKGGGIVGGGVLEWGSHCVDLCQWANDADGTAPIEYSPGSGDILTARYANGVKLVIRKKGWIPLGSCPVRFEGDDGWVETGDSGKVVVSSPELLSGLESDSSDGLSIKGHISDFLSSIRQRTPAICNADVAKYSHIACHAAGIALYLQRRLQFDPDQGRFVDDDQANRLLSEARRVPWAV